MAKIKVYKEAQHEIDSKIYGHFIEELGECIHDGIWAYSDKIKRLPMLDDEHLDHVRKDLFEAVRALVHKDGEDKTVLRWPGGCFSDHYHWQDGIGPRNQRPVRENVHWKSGIFRFIKSADGVPGPDYNNHFGTNEFLMFCEKAGVEPYINVNYGSGTPEEAADWVEYVNGSADTKWGGERAKVHPEPYGVKYWGIANEIWARWEKGHERWSSDYARRYLRFAKAMKERDPSIQLVACGTSKAEKEGGTLFAEDAKTWNRTLLKEIEGYVDFLSIHTYIPRSRFMWGSSEKYARKEKAARAILASPAMLKDELNSAWQDIVESLGKDTSVRVCFDEWNLWYHVKQVIKANYALVDGIWVASVLHVLQEFSPVAPIANLAQMVNVLGLIRTDDHGIVKTPSYYAFQLLRQHSHPGYLKTEVECESYESGKFGYIKPLKTPFLDCGATVSKDGKNITLSVVNKHLEKSITSSIEIEGSSQPVVEEVIELSHNDLFAFNTPENRNNVIPIHIAIENKQLDKFEFPPHSLTILKFIYDQR